MNKFNAYIDALKYQSKTVYYILYAAKLMAKA